MVVIIKCIDIFIELKKKTQLFLTGDKSELAGEVDNEIWLRQLGFMIDIFQILNKLNVKFQGF